MDLSILIFDNVLFWIQWIGLLAWGHDKACWFELPFGNRRETRFGAGVDGSVPE